MSGHGFHWSPCATAGRAATRAPLAVAAVVAAVAAAWLTWGWWLVVVPATLVAVALVLARHHHRVAVDSAAVFETPRGVSTCLGCGAVATAIMVVARNEIPVCPACKMVALGVTPAPERAPAPVPVQVRVRALERR